VRRDLDGKEKIRNGFTGEEAGRKKKKIEKGKPSGAKQSGCGLPSYTP